MSTIAQIIALVDETKPNAFSESVKVRWIAELDGKIAVDVFLMHHSETAQLNYKWPESMNTEPLVPFPHDDIYALWLEAKIDYANGEYNKYQNTMESYNESYGNFVRWFTRNYQPAQGGGCELRSDVTLYYITAYGLAVKQGYEGTLDEWLESLRGPKGDPGVSPYEFARAGGFEGTEAEFLYKLLHDGKTAWEYAVEGGYKGTEAEFAALLANAAAKTDIPKIDTTLSAQGQAADSAAVGTALAGKLSEGLYSAEKISVNQNLNTPTFWEQVDAIYNAIPEHAVKFVCAYVTNPYPVGEYPHEPAGGVYRVTITRMDEGYGFVEASVYLVDPLGLPTVITRIKSAGVWRDPVKPVDAILARINAATGVAE